MKKKSRLGVFTVLAAAMWCGLAVLHASDSVLSPDLI